MPSKKTPPIVILDVANLGSVSRLSKEFPSLHKHLCAGRINTAKGGKKFKLELEKANSFFEFFNELSRSNLVHKVDDASADAEVANFEMMIQAEFKRSLPECDDPHLFALLKLSKSKTVISCDARISSCGRCLRRSKIDNKNFTYPKRLGTDSQYLGSFNSKNL